MPTSIASSGDSEDAFKTVTAAVSSSEATMIPFEIPELKIGTLDTLVLQADELAKLDGATEGTVAKVADILNSIFEGEERRITESKTINESKASFTSPIVDGPLNHDSRAV